MSRRAASSRPRVKPKASATAALSPRAQLGFGLADVTRSLRMLYDERSSEEGLTGASWRVLAYLYREDGLTQTRLAEMLEMTRPAIGQMIDRLEAGGFVERRAEPNDRRSWGVYLSPHAQAKVAYFVAASRAIEAECFDVFTDAELATLSVLVERLRDHLLRLQSASREDGGDR
jgi:MarR family transcriptional regulator for hemolysin